MKIFSVCLLVLTTVASLFAAQFSYNNNGGSVAQTSTTLTISGTTLVSPVGVVSMSCPLTSISPTYPYTAEWTCAGGNLSMNSNDGKTAVSGSFVSGLFTLTETTVSGVTYYYYAFSANFSGSRTVNGSSMAVVGAVSQQLAAMQNPLDPATGTIQTGLIDLSQEYEPTYIADTGNNRLVETADILGSNWASIGKAGNAVKQFSSPWGVAVDSLGKIYVSDSGNCRIVRMDAISGLNWISFGSCGSGAGHFSAPKGLWVDSSGKIYVADSGNNRIVRMDDITGTNFTSLGSTGTGVHQFNDPAAVTTDSIGNIYVADNGNSRVAKFSDMLGTHWAVLQFPVGYVAPNGITLDSANKIYITDSQQNQFIRVDNIKGANETTISGGNSPAGVFVDSDGALYLANAGTNSILRYFDFSTNDVINLGTSGKGIGNFSHPHGVAAVTVAKPIAVSAVVPASLEFPPQLLGTASPDETTVLTNIGTSPLKVDSVVSSLSDFQLTQNCPATLVGGQNCSASIIFQPTTGGLRKGAANFTLTGAASRSVPLTGSGALVTLSTTQLIMYEGQQGTVTVTNPLSSSTSVTVKVKGKFTQTNSCGLLAPSASCTVTVSWSGVPTVLGTLIVTDSSGTSQYVSLVGE